MRNKKVTTNTGKVNKRNQRITVLQVILLIGAVIAFLYPVIRSVYFQHNNYEVISHFEDEEHTEATLNTLKEKNKEITEDNFYTDDPFTESETTYKDERPQVIGVLEVPELTEKYAVYDRTTKEVLATGVGLLEGTHYPTGEISQTTALTGHNGTHDATIFQNLHKLDEGDTFTFNNGLEILTYEIYSMEIVLPEETSKIQNTEDQNTMILITCITPDITKGLNTHRLIIHGKRVKGVVPKDKTFWEEVVDFIKKNIKFVILLTVALFLFIQIIRLILPLLVNKEQEKWIIELKKRAITLYLLYVKYLAEENISYAKEGFKYITGEIDEDILEECLNIIDEYTGLGWKHITIDKEKDKEVFKRVSEQDKVKIEKFHVLKEEIDTHMKENRSILQRVNGLL